MNKIVLACCTLLGLSSATQGEPALTIYNEDFAVVRDTVPLDLKAGLTDVRFTEATAYLEPDSVVLRDPAGKVPLRVVEQNYRFQSVSQALLLSKFEGKTISFRTEGADGKPGVMVQGKIIRSGYAPRFPDDNASHAGPEDAGEAGSGQGPIIEVNGTLRFSLPGEPLFPSLGDDTLLKPTLDWKVYSHDPAKLDAELAYVTKHLNWHADYSVIAPEEGDTLDLVGLVTISNRSGKSFENAKVKLMAGLVNKLEDDNNSASKSAERVIVTGSNAPAEGPPTVKVKDFDEYHLYTLPLPTSLQDQETKQIEFTRAAHVPSRRLYVYDGYKADSKYENYGMENIMSLPDYGTGMTAKVHILREFKNTEANGLGIALPKGRLRFYRRDGDGQLEFTGENTIDHTSKDETLSIYSGDAFDLVGSRRRIDFKSDSEKKTVDESFEIKLRNHKKEPVEIQVVEHLYRWINWTLLQPKPWTKLDAQTMETQVSLRPDEEKTLSYTVHYASQ